jgi:hypothetical protein
MKTLSNLSFTAIFAFFSSCANLGFFQSSSGSGSKVFSGIFQTDSPGVYTPRYFTDRSVHRVFLSVSQLVNGAKIEKTDLQVIEYTKDFLFNQEKFFPGIELIPFKIESVSWVGTIESVNSGKGFVVHYITEIVQTGAGSNLESAWSNYSKSAYLQSPLSKKEKYEIRDDDTIWLVEESENLFGKDLVWRHKTNPMYPSRIQTEFKSQSLITESDFYDYTRNQYKKLKIEKKPDDSNLVIDGKEAALYFLSGKLSLEYK